MSFFIYALIFVTPFVFSALGAMIGGHVISRPAAAPNQSKMWQVAVLVPWP
jgi:hypothetical protein